MGFLICFMLGEILGALLFDSEIVRLLGPS